MVYIYNEILLNHKKKETTLFAATRMDLEIIILSAVSQTKTNIDITYMWKLKYDTNELICKTERGLQI